MSLNKTNRRKVSIKGVVAWLLILLPVLTVGCSNTAQETNGDVDNVQKKVEEEQKQTPPINMDQLKLDITIKKPDSIGAVYMDGTLTNNSDKILENVNITVLRKDTNEKTYLSFVDTIMPKEKSPKTETFAPNSGKKEDMEILKWDIAVKGDDGQTIYLEYDCKTKEYKWY